MMSPPRPICGLERDLLGIERLLGTSSGSAPLADVLARLCALLEQRCPGAVAALAWHDAAPQGWQIVGGPAASAGLLGELREIVAAAGLPQPLESLSPRASSTPAPSDSPAAGAPQSAASRRTPEPASCPTPEPASDQISEPASPAPELASLAQRHGLPACAWLPVPAGDDAAPRGLLALFAPDGLPRPDAEAIAQLAAAALRLEHERGALREDLRLYRMMYDATPVMMHSIDRESRVIAVNEAWLQTMGYSRDEVLGRHILDFLTPRSRKHGRTRIAEFWRVGWSRDLHFEFVTRSGRILDVLLSSVAFRDMDGAPRCSLATVRNVTQQRAAQQSAQLARHIVDHAADAMVLLDRDGRCVDANAAACRLLGRSRETLLRMRVDEIHPRYRTDTLAADWQVLRETGPVVFESDCQTPDGRLLPIEVSNHLVTFGALEYCCVFARDITDRRQAEQLREDAFRQIRSSRNLLACLLQASSDLQAARTPAEALHCIVHALQAAGWTAVRAYLFADGRIDTAAHAGAADDALHAIERHLPEIPDLREPPWNAAMVSRSFVIPGGPLRLELPASSEAPVRSEPDCDLACVPLRDGKGDLVGVLLLISPPGEQRIDLTAIQYLELFADLVVRTVQGLRLSRAQEQAELEAQRMILAFEAGGVGIAQLDEHARFVSVREPFAALHGASPAALAAAPWERTLAPPVRPAARGAWAHMQAHGLAEFETRGLRADGTEFDQHCVLVQINDASGRASRHYCLVRDVSERKRAEARQRRLEEQLRQAQKMEALGQLAGGVAHDFNNVLTAILGNIDILLPQQPGADAAVDLSDAFVRECLNEIRSAGQRVATLTRQLLTFSRRQITRPAVIDLSESLAALRALLQRLIGEHYTLDLDLPSEPVWALADPAQIQQAVLNLVMNATDAMPDGGRILVAARRLADGQAAAADLPAHVRPPVLVISVHDEGTGIPPEALPHIFEPFFTTKPVGKGTGLGLSIVYGIVTQLGGHIAVQSASGAGTTVRVYLREHVAEPPPAAGEPRRARGRGETVLLCEDDELVRQVTSRALRHAGFVVLEAARASEALRRAESDPIDLLVTDVIMPEMNGPQLADALRRDRPHLRVLFTSGYPSDILDRHGVSDASLEFLQKPYAPGALAERVRRLLDEPAPLDAV